MDIFKSFSSRLCLYLVSATFFLSAGAFALFNVIEASNIKETLKEEDTYSKIVPAVLSTANYGEGASTGQDLPLDEPWVRTSVERAFPANDLENKGSTVIDSTFVWLKGDTPEPQFQLDFTQNKQRLVEEIGANAQNRLGQLPACNLNNIPESVDAFRVECLPFGISSDVLANEAADRVNSSGSFLEDPIITSGNIDGSDTDGNQFKDFDGLQSLFNNKNLWLWGLPILTILLGVVGVLLAKDRSRALQRLSRSLVFSGAGLAVFALVISFGLEQTFKAVSKDAVTRDLAMPVLVNLAHQIRNVYLGFAILAFIIALGVYIARKKVFPAKTTR